MQNKIFTIGSATIDIVTLLSSDKVEQLTLTNAKSTYLMIKSGSKVESKIATHIGGGALNTAFNYSKLGMDCVPIVKCGEDIGRQRIKKHLQNNNISADCVFVDSNLPTGSSIIISSHTGDAAVLNQAGANIGLSVKDIQQVDWHNVQLLHIAPLNQQSSELLPACVNYASKNNAFITVNLGKKQIKNNFDDYLRVASNTHILSVNYEEAVHLIKQFINRKIKIIDNTDTNISINTEDFSYDFSQFANVLHTIGVPYVLMTNGLKGAWLSYNGEITFTESIKNKVVSTTGAGDAFCSTLAWALLQDMSAIDALCAASINSSSVVGYEDTTTGLLSKKELMHQLSNK